MARAAPPAESFGAWRAGFRARALAQGIRPEVFDAAFQGVAVNPEVARLDSSQAEFTKPIWEYLDGAASPNRIETGRLARAKRAQTLAAIESRYGVDPDVVLAIWGMETNYGSNRGSMSVIESLATLAYEGRRRDFAEEQLLAALRILQAGDVDPAHMRGSWAGAMGHTQFMPTSYPELRRRLQRRRPPRRLVGRPDRRARLRRQLPRPLRLDPRPALGGRGAAAGGVQLRQRRPVEHPPRRRLARPRRDADERPAAARPRQGRGHRPRRSPRPRPSPSTTTSSSSRSTTTPPPTRWASATSATASAAAGHRRAPGRAASASSRGPRRSSCRSCLIARGYDTGSTDGVIGPDTISAIRAYQPARGPDPRRLRHRLAPRQAALTEGRRAAGPTGLSFGGGAA